MLWISYRSHPVGASQPNESVAGLQGKTYCFRSVPTADERKPWRGDAKRLVAEFTTESGKAVFPGDDGTPSAWPVEKADVTGASPMSGEEGKEEVREAPVADVKRVAGKVCILEGDLGDLGAGSEAPSE